MQTLFNPASFELNEEILKLIQENAELQASCEHHFVDGQCEFCYMSEEDYNDLIHNSSMS